MVALDLGRLDGCGWRRGGRGRGKGTMATVVGKRELGVGCSDGDGRMGAWMVMRWGKRGRKKEGSLGAAEAEVPLLG